MMHSHGNAVLRITILVHRGLFKYYLKIFIKIYLHRYLKDIENFSYHLDGIPFA